MATDQEKWDAKMEQCEWCESWMPRGNLKAKLIHMYLDHQTLVPPALWP